MDIFADRMTYAVVNQDQDNSILIVNVLRSMTRTGTYCKQFLKQMFSEWYSPQVGKQLANKVELENVEVKLKLSTLKPLQVGWIIELSNEMKSSKGAGIIKSG